MYETGRHLSCHVGLGQFIFRARVFRLLRGVVCEDEKRDTTWRNGRERQHRWCTLVVQEKEAKEFTENTGSKLQSRVVTICTSSLAFNIPTFCLHNVIMYCA